MTLQNLLCFFSNKNLSLRKIAVGTKIHLKREKCNCRKDNKIWRCAPTVPYAYLLYLRGILADKGMKCITRNSDTTDRYQHRWASLLCHVTVNLLQLQRPNKLYPTCDIKSSFKTGLQIFRDKSYTVYYHFYFDKTEFTLQIGDHFFLNL